MLAPLNNDSIEIRDVWSDNLEQEFRLISDIVDKYPYVGMDTEFPGTVLNPAGIPKDSNDYNYNYCALKVNVNILKLIQVGLTFSDEKGNLPTCGTDKYIIWQFNFREFSPDEDEHIKESIQLLGESGIDFSKNREKGVNVKQFGALLMSSGVVLNDDVQWVTFHGGIDFGYLLKLLTCKDLPETEKDFFELLNTFFPVIYDIKYLIKFTNGLYGGLSSLAQAVGVERVGVSHQAGSDSLLTVCIFIKMKEYNYVPSMEKYAGVLYRLGSDSRY